MEKCLKFCSFTANEKYRMENGGKSIDKPLAGEYNIGKPLGGEFWK